MEESRSETSSSKLPNSGVDNLFLTTSVESRFRSEPVHIPEEVKNLEKEDIINSLASLPEIRRQEIVGDNARLLCFAMTRSDKWGRPLKATQQEIISVLENITSRPWNLLFTKTWNTLKENLFLNTSDNSTSEIFENYLRNQLVFGDKREAIAGVFEEPRFSNTNQLYSLYYDRLREKQQVLVLSELKPPHDYDDWVEAIQDTIYLIDNKKINMPDESLTAGEQVTANVMLAEFVHGFVVKGGSVDSLKPEITGKGWDVPFDDLNDLFLEKKIKNVFGMERYDPSADELERFRFCLKMALRFRDPVNESEMKRMSPAEKVAMLALRDENKMVEFIEWIASAGYDEEPQWFHARTKQLSGKSREDEHHSKIFSFLDELPKPARANIRIFYAGAPVDIPADMNKFDITSNKYTEIKLDDLNEFNRTLSEIFGNPGSDAGKGRYAARAIAKVLQNPDMLIPVPYTGDWGFQHLRKLDVASQSVGVYGNWTTKWGKSENQIMVLTAQHKNLRRTRTGR